MSSYPTPILRTGRLALRPLAPGDADDLFTIFSDPAVTRFWGDARWTSTTTAHEAIERAQACYRDQSELRFGVELLETKRLIGTVSLYDFYPAHRRCEIGYALGSAHWGKGYALEALEAAFDFGFHTLGLNRVEADIDPRNTASIALMERLGFCKEGFMPERWFIHGETADTVYYGLLRRYWDTRAKAAPRSDAREARKLSR